MWYDNWQERKERLETFGLPVIILGVELTSTGFLSLLVQADEAYLLRSHRDRGFELHMSLGYLADYEDKAEAQAAGRLHHRWAGQCVLLNIEWVGSGGAAFLHRYDMISDEPDFRCLHQRGCYRDRQPHASL
jgi:hypothetical protein